MWTDDYALNLELARKNTSLYRNYYSKGADFLRELGTPESNIWALEEEFLVLSGDRPLQKLARKLPWLNISNRAFITGTNEMLWDIYEGHLRTLIHHNEQFRAGHLAGQPVEYADLRTPSYWPFTPGIKDKKLGEADIQRSMNNVSEMLAEMSARGPMGVSWKKQSFKDYHSFLNAAFFSFRSFTGRLLSPRHMMSGDPFVRRAAWKNMLTFVGSMMGIILAGQRMGAWETETDCRSSEFMKIKLNDGRLSVDAWGGTQQYAVLYCRLMPGVGGIKGLDHGAISDYDLTTGVARFSRNKASPGLGAALMIFYGEDFRGTEIDRRDAKMWIENHYPMSVQDVMEAYESAGLLGLYVGAPVGIFGGGIIARDLTLNDVAMREYGVSYSDLDPLEGWERKAGHFDYRAEVRKMWELDLTEAEQARKKEKELKKEQAERDRDDKRGAIKRQLDEERRERREGQYPVPSGPRVTPVPSKEPGEAIGGGSTRENFPLPRPVGR
jgi:hypothetical protein